MSKIYKERVPSKPSPDEQSTVYPFNDNKQFDIETRKYQNLGHISLYRRIKGNKMVSVATGEVIDIKKKEKRVSRAVFKIFKQLYRLIKNNFFGRNSEILIILEFEEPITDIEEINKLTKSIIEKTQRRLGKIVFIRVLVYYEENKPEIEIWVKKADNSKIEITEEEIEKLWNNGKVTVRNITKNNIDYVASYFKRNIEMDLYPTGIKIYSTSKDIKKVAPIVMSYEDAEKLVAGYTPTYSGAVSIKENIENTEKEIQHITYESFEKKETQRKIKSYKTTKPVKAKGNFAKRFKKQDEENHKIIKELAEDPNCWVSVNRLNIDWYETVSKGKNKIPKKRNAEETITFLEAIKERNKNIKGGK